MTDLLILLAVIAGLIGATLWWRQLIHERFIRRLSMSSIMPTPKPEPTPTPPPAPEPPEEPKEPA